MEESPLPPPLAAAPAPTGSDAPPPETASLLSSAPPNVPWRRRGAQDGGEIDEAVFAPAAAEGGDGGDGGAAGARVFLRSLSGPGAPQEESVLVFENASPRSVRILWLDFKGQEIPYSTPLKPGETTRYRTWPNHAWVAREVTSCRRMLLNGAQAVLAGANTTPVIISNPPELAWCETTHAGFSPAFRQQAQALLLCWQRQGGAAGWGSGGDGGGSLGSLPYDLVRVVLEQAAPRGVCQDGHAAYHPGIAPVALPSGWALQQLAADTAQRFGGRMAPRPQLTAEELLLPVAALAAPSPSPALAAAIGPLGAVLHALQAMLGGA